MAAYLSAREAAAHLGKSYRGFDQWVRRHGVPYKRYGRDRMFTVETLDRVMATMALRHGGSRTAAAALLCCLLAAPLQAQTFPITLGVSLAADGADLASTARAIHLGGREANPVLSAAPVPLKLATTAAFTVAAMKLHTRHPKLAVGLVVVNAVIKGWATAHNLKVGR